MKTRWLSLNVGAWIWMLALSAQAFPLGAAKDEIVRRYGNPPEGSEVKDTGHYFWSGWELEIQYVQGCARQVIYRKINPLTESDLAALLKQNDDGKNWHLEALVTPQFRRWVRADWASAQWWPARPRELRLTASSLPRLSATAPVAPVATASPIIAKMAHPAASFPPVLSFATTPVHPVIPAAAPPTPDPLAQQLGSFFRVTFAVVIPLSLLILVVRRRQRMKRKSTPDEREIAPEVPPDIGEKSDGWHFELVVGEIYRRCGYAVEMMPADGPDDGVDIILRNANERVLVQCKHWNSKVTVHRVREFAAVVADQQADRGIFVTTADYTRDAIAFSERNGLQLIGRRELNVLMNEVAEPGEDLWKVSEWINQFAAQVTLRDPWCPRCREEMKIRQGRRGLFWGCSRFPRCDGKRNAREELLEDRRSMPA